LGGRKVEYEIYDTMASAEEAVKAARKAIVNDKVKALVGLWEASEGIAVADLCKANREFQIPLVETVPGPEEILENGYPGLIMTGTHTYGECTPWFYLAKKEGIKSVVIVFEEIQYNRSLERHVDQRWGVPGSPVKVLDKIWHPVGKGELSTELTKAIAAKPQAIIVSDYTYPAVAAALKGLYDLQYDGIRIFAAPLADPWWLPEFATEAEGSITASGFGVDPSIPANKAYTDLCKKRITGADANKFNNCGAYTWNGTMILLKSMDKAGTDSDNAKIWKAMQALDWTTAMGDKVKFLPNGRLLYSKGFIMKIKGGHLVTIDHYPIAPEDYLR
jgi:ABC-type branched-subunit amino acid transport system substrate-binding protein